MALFDETTLTRGLLRAILVSLLCMLPACEELAKPLVPVEQGHIPSPLKDLRALAEEGDIAAQNNLGVKYDIGQGVSQDYQEAVHWYRLAAARGSADAHYNLCMAYDHGKGLPQDYQQAMQWCHLAADQGQGRAMFNLALHYHVGRGVREDLVQAHKWYNLATAAGYQEGQKWRDRLALLMTPAQLAEAQRLAREWMPKGKTE